MKAISFFTSSIGRKWIVAVTGLVLVAFVVGHMVGNLQIFLGSESINRYGSFLQGLGELLWAVRLGLLAMLVLHVVTTIQLRLANRAARPVGYAMVKRRASSFTARWMLWSGLMVLCFLIFHILHFTVQSVDRSYVALHDSAGRHDVYRMMITGFSNKAASGFYLAGVALLSLHLSHGFQSLFQTLGLNSVRLALFWTRASQVLAWLLFLGYASIPVAVLAHIVK